MKLVRNFLSLAGAEATSKLLTFAAFAYLARVSGPERFGFLEYAGAALFCASLLVEQGFGPYGAREIAKAPEKTGDLVSEIVVARLILSIASYAALIGFAFMIDHSIVVTQLLLLYGASLLALPLLLQWVFQGHDMMGTVAAAQLIRQAVFAIVIFVFVRTPDQIWYAAIAEIAGVCCTAIFCSVIYLNRFGFIRRIHLISGKLIREGIPIGLGQMFWVVRFIGSTLIMGLIAASADVGYFAGALRILIAVHTFVWLYYFNLLPSLSRLWQEDAAAFSVLIDRSLHTISWIGVIGGMLWFLLAPLAMVIVYGSSFEAAGTTLRWFAGVCLAALLSGHYRFGLIAAGRQNIEMATSALGTVVALATMPVGYSRYGLSGAAVGLLLAEVTVWLVSWWFGRRVLGLRRHFALLFRPFLAAIGATFLIWCMAVESLPLKLLTASGTLLLMLWLTESAVRQSARSMSFMRAFHPRN
ncbi:MAG: oligosaccharide flippase family protein [Acidobacteria bacterium]|nr:oligosaccharide flippase family protein [Acidobacteriota bacterium]